MGFTIEDVLTISRDKYKMQLIGGERGWSNSISWILLIEDSMILKDFRGRDLAVTTGLGFDSEKKMRHLVESLVQIHAAGLIINVGQYINTISDSIIGYCDENDFPLLTVPWDVHIYDMIKELSFRVLLQSETDQQLSTALIHGIEEPETIGMYEKNLLPHFDLDGSFQVALISTGDLDSMDTVERRRISYQIQIYLENITHNGHFFYYDSYFVLVVNDVTAESLKEILYGFLSRARRKMPSKFVCVGVGSQVRNISNLRLAYRRAKVAVNTALKKRQELLYFDKMGIYRLFGMVADHDLLREMGPDVLRPLLEYDEKHDSEYIDTLACYLESNGSVQNVAKQLFTHRNTVIYRMGNIKKILGSNLDTQEERLKYMIACMIVKSYFPVS